MSGTSTSIGAATCTRRTWSVSFRRRLARPALRGLHRRSLDVSDSLRCRGRRQVRANRAPVGAPLRRFPADE
jgi:hypothetical protein